MNSTPDPLACRQCGEPIVDANLESDATICASCTNAMTIAPFEPLATQMPTGGYEATADVDELARLDRYVNQVEIGTWLHGKIYQARHDGLDCDVLIQTLVNKTSHR